MFRPVGPQSSLSHAPVGSTNGRVPSGRYPSVESRVGGFLAGFLEGEACFTIPCQSRGHGYRCMMRLSIRDDDSELLRTLARNTRLGTIRSVPARRTSRPQLCWTVLAKSDCRRLVALLYEYPFRGRRAREFAIWAAAVKWWVGEDAIARRPAGNWGPGRISQRTWPRLRNTVPRRIHSSITIRRVSSTTGRTTSPVSSPRKALWAYTGVGLGRSSHA